MQVFLPYAAHLNRRGVEGLLSTDPFPGQVGTYHDLRHGLLRFFADLFHKAIWSDCRRINSD